MNCTGLQRTQAHGGAADVPAGLWPDSAGAAGARQRRGRGWPAAAMWAGPREDLHAKQRHVGPVQKASFSPMSDVSTVGGVGLLPPATCSVQLHDTSIQNKNTWFFAEVNGHTTRDHEGPQAAPLKRLSSPNISDL